MRTLPLTLPNGEIEVGLVAHFHKFIGRRCGAGARCIRTATSQVGLLRSPVVG